MISSGSLFFFSDEIQKCAGMPAPQQAQQPEKKQSFLSRNKMTLGGTALAAGLVLKNPKAAAKYLGQMKQMVTNPKAALQRGWRSGSSNVAKGSAGASEAASKRVSLYKDVLRSAEQGKLQSIKSLDTIGAGGTSARASGWGSAGRSFSRGGQELKMSPDLTKRVGDMQAKLKAGEEVSEQALKGLYGEIQGAGKGLKMRKGLTHYAPGERTVMTGLGTGLGATAGLETHDAETGRKRGVAERVARGTVGAATGTAMSSLFMGRGARLSSKNLFTGNRGSLLSQKGLLPIAASFPLLAGTEAAGEVAGKGGELADRAFGQKS